MAEDQPFYDDVMTLADYATLTGKTIEHVRREARLGRIPTWPDPHVGQGKVTSPKAIAFLRDKVARKAVEEAASKVAPKNGKSRG